MEVESPVSHLEAPEQMVEADGTQVEQEFKFAADPAELKSVELLVDLAANFRLMYNKTKENYGKLAEMAWDTNKTQLLIDTEEEHVLKVAEELELQAAFMSEKIEYFRRKCTAWISRLEEMLYIAEDQEYIMVFELPNTYDPEVFLTAENIIGMIKDLIQKL